MFLASQMKLWRRGHVPSNRPTAGLMASSLKPLAKGARTVPNLPDWVVPVPQGQVLVFAPLALIPILR